MADPGAPVVAVGSRVRIRSIRQSEARRLPFRLVGEDNPEVVVIIVEPADVGSTG